MKKLLLITVLLGLLGSIVLVMGGVGLYMWADSDLPSFKKLTDYRPALVTTVYARDNSVLGYLYAEKRFLVTLKDMPGYLPKAFLAAEDSSFYTHEGVDPMAIVRAFMKNMQHGGMRQGGSTITQQVIKRLLLTPEKSLQRKLKEALLAYRLEHYLSKDEILTIYLNQIYLGSKAYGVEAAARTYFGRHVGQLTLAQAAMLAGLPQAPSRYSPLRDFEAAKTRQKYVLSRLLEMGWITKEDHDKAVAEPMVFSTMEDPSWQVGPYYLEEVRRWLVEKYGEDTVYTAGLHVYTAVDLKHQRAAEAAMRRGLSDLSKRRGWRGPLTTLAPNAWPGFLAKEQITAEHTRYGKWFKAIVSDVNAKSGGVTLRFANASSTIDKKNLGFLRGKSLKPGDVVWASFAASSGGKTSNEVIIEQEPEMEGALVSMDPKSGDVLACVGGFSFDRSQFNRATQSLRQPGSSFKPFVYSAAMDEGFTPGSVVSDSPFVYEDPVTHKVWKPENYEGGHGGPMTLRSALAKSKNLVTVKIAHQIGIQKVIKRARDLGLTCDLPPYLPLALGAASVNILNMCEAYSAFARDGSTVRPRFVKEVKSPWGERVYEGRVEEREAISPQNAYIMSGMLRQVVQSGTAARANVLKRAIAGKTGTTNNEHDAWFIGFSPYLLSAVYVGFDVLAPLGKGETGGHAALPVWLEYRQVVENDFPAEDFKMPPGIVMVAVDGVPMPFKEGTERSGIAVLDDGPQEGGGNDPSGPMATGEDLLKMLY